MEFTSIARKLNTSGFAANAEPSLNYVSQSLEKSEIADCFGYGVGDAIRITGKEIKAGLNKVKKYITQKKVEVRKTMSDCLSKCDCKPKREIGKYETKGLEAFMEEIPKFFGYEDTQNLGNDQRGNADKYNEAARHLIHLQVEEIYANALLSTMQDGSLYSLSLKQAVQIGVGNK